MPELPEVETVRAGLARWVVGRTIATVEVLHPRAVRRHAAGGADFAAVLAGRTITEVHRRGKYLWFALDSGDAVVGHLGMSGQMLLLDQPRRPGRTCGSGSPSPTAGRSCASSTSARSAAWRVSPGRRRRCRPEIAHIARDPFDPQFDAGGCSWPRCAGGGPRVKRALLDQTLISGVGNIYADEALWRARLHGDAACDGAVPARRSRACSATSPT